MSSLNSRRCCRSLNLVAGCVSAASLFVLYSSVDPAPAGEDVRLSRDSAAESAAFVISDAVPVPPDAGVEPLHSASETMSAEAPPGNPPQPHYAGILDNFEAIRFSLLLLREGESFMSAVDRYSAVFTKQERVNGDLTESQIIDMKVQQDPVFSVYMKWRSGDAGRQVLYSDEYEDKQMVVKLGGLKGRLLPAIKLDPTSERAMSESRHPITSAGIHAMLKQMIGHRQDDLNRGHGVVCRRLPNQVFDERDCFCFSYEYESPELSPTYRKSIVLIDARHCIPMMARQFTWARDAEELTPEQLDEQTLVEHYSFTSINLEAALVAEDFSRENPKYRM